MHKTLALSVGLVVTGVALNASATPLQFWTPSAASVLKTATSCHDLANDVYGVAAVFQSPSYFGGTYDAVYYLRIDGDSTSPTYGQLLSSTWLDGYSRIDHVDCANNGNDVFVAYDRYYADAAWMKVNGTTKTGPFVITPASACGAGYTHKPRIAHGPSWGGRLMIAFDSFHYETTPETAGCEVCTQQYTTSGSLVSNTANYFWPDGMLHDDYDVVWNGSRFLFALGWRPDNGGNYLSTQTFASSGGPQTENLIASFPSGSNPAYPTQIKLVHSYNTGNYSYRSLLHTNTGTWWLNSPGGGVSGAAQATNSGTGFAACDYWGPYAATANIFSPRLSFEYVGGFPNGYFITTRYTERAHARTYSSALWDLTSLNTTYYPVACSTAATYTDPEVLLVSRNTSDSNKVFWNIQASH